MFKVDADSDSMSTSRHSTAMCCLTITELPYIFSAVLLLRYSPIWPYVLLKLLKLEYRRSPVLQKGCLMDFQEYIEVKVLLGKPFFQNYSAWLSLCVRFLSVIFPNAASTGDFFRSGVAIFHVRLHLFFLCEISSQSIEYI